MNIREARKSLNLTQKDVHRILGVPTRTLQHWEAEDRQCPEWLMPILVETLRNRVEAIANAQTETAPEESYASSTAGDYSASTPWDAPGMSVYDFI